MGNKISNGSSPRSGTSAKLIRVDGDLQEFFNPIKISTLLTKNSDTFICNSDQMDFNRFLTAMKAEEELRVGQLYFELPVSNWLTQRIQAADMVSLAVKASSALEKNDDKVMRCGCYYGGRKRVDPMDFEHEDYDVRPMQLSRKKSDDIAGGVAKRKNKLFVAQLSVIRED